MTSPSLRSFENAGTQHPNNPRSIACSSGLRTLHSSPETRKMINPSQRGKKKHVESAFYCSSGVCCLWFTICLIWATLAQKYLSNGAMCPNMESSKAYWCLVGNGGMIQINNHPILPFSHSLLSTSKKKSKNLPSGKHTKSY